MKRIFEDDVERYLRETGVSHEEIAKIKYTEVKEGAIKILKKMISLIEQDEIRKAESMLEESPAGDGHG